MQRGQHRDAGPYELQLSVATFGEPSSCLGKIMQQVCEREMKLPLPRGTATDAKQVAAGIRRTGGRIIHAR